MTTLDGVERSFDAEAVLVCDRDGPSGIAGIMGGQVSEVSETTTRVLLEVATWNGVNILRTSRKLGLRSEASTRFEKQLHPELAMRAQRVASRLLVELCGARLVPGTIDVAAEIPSRARGRACAGARVERAARDARSTPSLRASYLERLGFGVEREGDDDSTATVPLRAPLRRHPRGRPDRGGRPHPRLRRAPARDPARAARPGRRPHAASSALRRRAEDVLRDLGFDEVVTLELHRPGPRRPAAARPAATRGAADRGLQPALRASSR